MNKKVFGLLAASLVAGNAFAQEDSTAAESNGLKHWSIQAHVGANVLSSAQSNDRNWGPNSDYNLQAGAQVEYTVNPLWGIGFDYSWVRNNQATYDNFGHDFALFASVNASNILAKYRSAGWQKFNTYVNGGFGVSAYKWENAKVADDNGCSNPFVLASINFEYNINKHLAVGLAGETRAYTSDAWHPSDLGEGKIQFLGDVTLRYKFGGDNNVRNIALVDYEPKVEVPDLTPLLDEQKRQCQEMTSRLEDQIVNQNKAIKALQDELKATKDSLDSHIRATKPAQRYVPTKEEDEIIKTAFSQLEFETNSAVIKQSSYSSLDGLAALLKGHADWSIILKGYTDNSGQAAKNLQLSKDRAASVKAYMVNKGVAASRVQSFGYGSANPVASNATLAGRAKNRRVEIELYSK